MSPSTAFAAPSLDELNRRLCLVQNSMQATGLTHLVLVDPDSIFWLTNFANFIHERPFILVLSTAGEMQFVVPKLEIPHIKKRCIAPIRLVSYFEFPAPAGEQWSDALSALFDGSESVGIEHNCPRFVQDALIGDCIVTDIVEEARFIKSDYEVARIKYGCRIATERMRSLLKTAKPGKSALSVHSKVNKLSTLKLLLDNPDTNMLCTRMAGVVQPPSISHDPHNFTSVFDLGMAAGGPNISIVAGTMNGYGAEVERTFFLGTVPDAAREPYSVMMQARALAFKMCRPGTSMHDLDLAVNTLIREAGYGENLLHRTGHGIGVTGHEGPFLAEGFHQEIKSGMVFTIEPGIYVDGVGGFRHSDTVLVTETGCESLTPLPDGLEDMTLPIRGMSRLGLPSFQKPLLRLAARLSGIRAESTAP